jgi:hypothetical protein
METKIQVILPISEDQEVKNRVSVFLAGSISKDNLDGNAEKWQDQVIKELENMDVTAFNPRRDDWDSSWEQKQSNDQFNHQVNWELNRLESSVIIFFYFSPGTTSPISLLELGKFVGRKEVVVCCNSGFNRKGNVDILCSREGVAIFEDLESALGALKSKIRMWIR